MQVINQAPKKSLPPFPARTSQAPYTGKATRFFFTDGPSKFMNRLRPYR